MTPTQAVAVVVCAALVLSIPTAAALLNRRPKRKPAPYPRRAEVQHRPGVAQVRGRHRNCEVIDGEIVPDFDLSEVDMTPALPVQRRGES